MAGYDLSFNIPIRYRESAREWMNYFQRLARGLKLDVHYRTRVTRQGQVEICAKIDGSLSAMQHLHRHLMIRAAEYVIMSGRPETLRKYVLPSFMNAQTKGINNIADLIFDISADFGTKPTGLSFSSGLMKKLNGRRTKLNSSIQTIIKAMDEWIIGNLSNEDSIILCDQGIEAWLKVQLKLPSSSRDNFHDLLDKAIHRCLLTHMEAYRLRRFHKARNRVQHRGGRVGSETVLSMFKYCSRLVDLKTP